jgi:hypothetical protein
MKQTLYFALLLSLAPSAFAAAPALDDYSQGIRIDALTDRPLLEAALPDDVYRSVTRTDLADVRVFNADGFAVPHAFCEAPRVTEATVTQENLPVFEVQGATRGERGTRVEVQTAAGSSVRMQEGEAQSAGSTETQAHVIDARSVTDALRSIQFDWESPDGASEARVRIEASEDLDRWETVVGASTLLKVSQGDQELRRQAVPLPQRKYEYLRVARLDRGPPLVIAAVIAERVEAPQPIDPLWFAATVLDSTERGVLLFDSARLAPVTYARLALAQENTSLRVSIESRPDAKAQWRQQWSGEVYSIVTDGERRISPPAEFAATADKFWRVSPAKAGATFNPAPMLELGYRPARVRFLAQGAGPFTLAFGSRRAEPAVAQQCGGLLSDVETRDLEQMIGEASLGPPRSLGGAKALKPLPKKTPLRLFVLWGVLIVGVGLLVAMALSLLKRVNQQP